MLHLLYQQINVVLTYILVPATESFVVVFYELLYKLIIRTVIDHLQYVWQDSNSNQ